MMGGCDLFIVIIIVRSEKHIHIHIQTHKSQLFNHFLYPQQSFFNTPPFRSFIKLRKIEILPSKNLPRIFSNETELNVLKCWLEELYFFDGQHFVDGLLGDLLDVFF
jgi:hypothetical protein